ncbi:50S ribosomal protein L24e [Candidatus Woesearchaeota archaeon]|nr:50S ribosomal protein L24e [Candidatus Woesearchaeota archaeon]
MECTFCGKNIERGTGKMFVQNDGKILYFCTMKCEKNMLKLRRKAHTTPWTKEFRREKKPGKEGRSNKE